MRTTLSLWIWVFLILGSAVSEAQVARWSEEATHEAERIRWDSGSEDQPGTESALQLKLGQHIPEKGGQALNITGGSQAAAWWWVEPSDMWVGGADLGFSAEANASVVDVQGDARWTGQALGRFELYIARLGIRYTSNAIPTWQEYRFWRSRRGLQTLGGELIVPGLLSFATSDREAGHVSLFSLHYTWDALLREDDLGEKSTFIQDGSLVRWTRFGRGGAGTLDFASFRLEDEDLPIPEPYRALDVRVGVLTGGFDFFEASRFPLTPAFALDAKLGWLHLAPASLIENIDLSESKGTPTEEPLDLPSSPSLSVFTGFAGLHWFPTRTASVGLRMGSFERLDPTGYAVDEGYRAMFVGTAQPLPWLSLEAHLDGVRAERRIFSARPEVNPPTIDGNGSRIWLGRAEVATHMQFGFANVSLKGWAEISDRDILVEERAPLTTREMMGIDATLRLEF